MPNKALNFVVIFLLAFLANVPVALGWAAGWALYAVYSAPERELNALRRRLDA